AGLGVYTAPGAGGAGCAGRGVAVSPDIGAGRGVLDRGIPDTGMLAGAGVYSRPGAFPTVTAGSTMRAGVRVPTTGSTNDWSGAGGRNGWLGRVPSGRRASWVGTKVGAKVGADVGAGVGSGRGTHIGGK